MGGNLSKILILSIYGRKQGDERRANGICDLPRGIQIWEVPSGSSSAMLPPPTAI